MKITKLTKRLGRTINLGNFNSASFQEEAEVEVQPNEHVEEVEQKLYDLVTKMLTDDIDRMRKGLKEKKHAKQSQETSD